MVIDVFLFRRGDKPLLLDGGHLIASPSALVPTLCDRLGLDGSGVQLEWELISEEELEEAGLHAKALVQKSHGVRADN